MSDPRASTVIPDQDNLTRTSQEDGEHVLLQKGDATTVDGAPVLEIEDDDVRFQNAGTARTTGDTATVRISGDEAEIDNTRHGVIAAAQTGIEVTSEGSASILNRGEIAGGVNGVDFANGGGSSGLLFNLGTITSDSRAVNIGSEDITVVNRGQILGTGDQRNGTVYSDRTAEDYAIFNGRTGLIDAGPGNDGAGLALQTGDRPGDVVDARIWNAGNIAGRGQADPMAGTAGDGIRIFAGADDATFRGTLFNSGEITSESEQGPTAAIRIADGVNFLGSLVNARDGMIDGANNGLYFGEGEHDAVLRNFGTIRSDSRAVNIDGSGVHLINSGLIEGTDTQRNGTVYADSTADDYSVLNRRSGQIDAGLGNNGSGVALQTGDVDGDVVTASIWNFGTIRGRGDAGDGNTIGDGVRVFSGVADATLTGDIVNHGLIQASDNSATAVAIRIEDGVTLDGQIVNSGRLVATETAIDASGAGGPIHVVNTGTIEGEVVLSSNDDSFSGGESAAATRVDGGGGNDTLDGGAGDDFLAGGGGVDMLDGGDGNDTNSFSNLGVGVVGDLGTGSVSYQPAPGVTVFENFSNFENLDGSEFEDQLFGDDGANLLAGNDGDDLLAGRGGDDTLEGGTGDDLLRGGAGNDVTDGGEGIDTADFSDIGMGVAASLATGTAGYGAAQDTLIDIENLTGSANDDTLEGDDGDNLIAGGAGADTLSGGGGNDVLRGDAVGAGEAITVTVTNTLGDGGTFLTPVWFGFHDAASFDLYDAGAPASLGLERLAEDGSVEGIAAEFNQQTGDAGVDATVTGGAGVPGPIDPGESASFTLDVDPDEVGEGFFTWGTMIIPSNDAFLAAPDDPFSDPIFDADGNFLGPVVVQRFGSDVLDAGTEANTEEGAAFLNQTARDQGVPEDGVVGPHEGFNGSEANPDDTPVNILGGTTASGAVIDPVEGDFTRNGDSEQLLEIVIDRVAGFDDLLEGGAGDDTLDGGQGNDTLEGGSGADTLEGSSGADTFVFLDNPGVDQITDFEADADLINLSGGDFGFSSLGDVQAASSEVNGDVVIDLGGGNQITVLDLTVDELTDQNVLI